MYHELVFECAERVFAEEGFAESTMQDLAAEAGISLKTLYATFPGKDEIYREILAKRGDGLLDDPHPELFAAFRRPGGKLPEHQAPNVVSKLPR